jgi:hypothetical protein
VRQIFARGQQMGRRLNAVSKIGDSESANQHFLQPFSSPHNLGTYAYLEPVVTAYNSTDSLSRTGLANMAGFSAMSLLDDTWADHSRCLKDEPPLNCEYRLNNPAIALILIRTWDPETLGQDGVYHQALRQVVEYSIAQGVIPVLSTVPHHIPVLYSETLVNDLIRQVAAQYQVPLWDLWLTTETLPHYGIDFTGANSNHLNVPPDLQTGDLTGDHLLYGKNRRNLEALEILNILRTQVMGQ